LPRVHPHKNFTATFPSISPRDTQRQVGDYFLRCNERPSAALFFNKAKKSARVFVCGFVYECRTRKFVDKGDEMMKGRSIMIAASTAMILMIACAVYAGPRGWNGCPWAGGTSGLWSELSDDQRKQAEAMEIDFFKKMETLRATLGKKRVEMMELAAKETPDEEAIQKKREEIWAVRDTMRNERRGLKTKLRSLLTPEQRKKIGPFSSRLAPRGGYGPGKGFGRGPGCCAGGYGRGQGFRRGPGCCAGGLGPASGLSESL
jgi:Spy/CpxP family protein refolding chaperone